MVGLVLDGAGQHLGPLDDQGLAVHVEAVGHDLQRPVAVDAEAGDREAAFLAVLDLLGQRQLRVDEVAELAVDVPGEHPQPDTELGRGQAAAGRVEHGVGQVRHQGAQLLVEVDDRGRQACAARGNRRAGWA